MVFAMADILKTTHLKKEHLALMTLIAGMTVPKFKVVLTKASLLPQLA